MFDTRLNLKNNKTFQESVRVVPGQTSDPLDNSECPSELRRLCTETHPVVDSIVTPRGFSKCYTLECIRKQTKQQKTHAIDENEIVKII